MSEVTGSADALWVSVRGNHSGTVDEETGPQHRPTATTLQPRGAGRAYTAAVAKVNAELAGTEGWSPLPERMAQLRRGAAPELHLVPPRPDARCATPYIAPR
ncbi:hypothetical protein [Streptomyces sp. NRRL S-1022]|uniref:hypothetical protein n=1 Tax=Streptomyces sp. NRRL S-1022 TaxID=1463880 RepID=UPI001F365571|nr:hypothetical protein [Streptomyces sp. NRRL S-1022]